MTYYLYCDGGGTPTVPTYFSYILYKDNKPAGPVVVGDESESIVCDRFLTRFIPADEIPPPCFLIDKEGRETNNLAEYMALYYAIKRVKEVSGELPCTVRQDSQLIIKQVTGEWKCHKAHLIPWLKAVNAIKWDALQFEWVSREVIVEILGH